jgi:hypothetical protein
MDTANRTFHLIAFTVTAVLLLLISGEMVTRTMMSGDTMGSESMDALNWMWLPGLLLATLVAAFCADLLGRK